MTDVEVRAPAWQRRAVAALLATSFASGAVGNALTPVLLREPAVLLLVHASYAQMALASARLDPVVFVLVAGLRRWIGELVFYAGGRVLGHELLVWYAARRGKPLWLPHQLNHRWWPVRDAVIVALMHPVISAFFGAVQAPWPRFVALRLVGSLLWVTALWALADAVALPLEVAADFVEANAVVITATGLLLAFGWWWWKRRAART